jgi:hypothetical protein
MRGFHFLAEPKVSFVRKTLPAPGPILGKNFHSQKLFIQSKNESVSIRFFLLLPAFVQRI